MTPFGANHYGISQTKRFTILIPLNVLPTNKRKRGKSTNQQSFSKPRYHVC